MKQKHFILWMENRLDNQSWKIDEKFSLAHTKVIETLRLDIDISEWGVGIDYRPAPIQLGMENLQKRLKLKRASHRSYIRFIFHHVNALLPALWSNECRKMIRLLFISILRFRSLPSFSSFSYFQIFYALLASTTNCQLCTIFSLWPAQSAP